MTTLLIILILVACVILSFFVLIQKPKGGGLSGSFGSLGTQVMGVKQSGDVMEKGTWYTIAAIGILSVAVVFTLNISRPTQPEPQQQGQQSAPTEQSAPQQAPQETPAQ